VQQRETTFFIQSKKRVAFFLILYMCVRLLVPFGVDHALSASPKSTPWDRLSVLPRLFV
jgi:hypothetical protein